MKPNLLLMLVLGFLIAGCAGERRVLRPGRGVAVEERGPVARVYPRGEEAREARHGLWRGYDAEGVRRWEVRYIRGNPTGAYREWDAEGELSASWTYDWDGNLTGWLRWFEDGAEVWKYELEEEGERPDFDPIGRGEALRAWARERAPREETGAPLRGGD